MKNATPKAKRLQILAVVLGTLVALGGLGFGLIKRQYDQLTTLGRNKGEADSKLQVMQTAVKNADEIEAALAEVAKALSDQEATLASGDLYSWCINTMKRFRSGYKVELPQFGPISSQTEVSLLPRFPYKQATLSVGGKACYHDLGRFLADFENQYPFMRVANLTLDLDAGQATADREKLSFKMDIITLVKPGNP